MGETIMQKHESNTIVTDIENAEVLEFGKRDFNAYNRMLNNIEKGFTKASDAYVMIATNLWQIYHDEYFRIDSYKTIADFALDKFELKKSTTHNYIKVMEKFGDIVDGKAKGIKEQFKDFKCSQLVNMLTLTPEQLEQVRPDWSVREIIAFGKNPILIEETEDTAETASTSPDADSDPDVEEPDLSQYLNTPDIISGRTSVLECDAFEDIEKHRDIILSAFNDMKADPNFANKKIRLVVELAFD